MPKRKCKGCGERFSKETMIITPVSAYCSYDCLNGSMKGLIKKGREKQEKEFKKETRRLKEESRPISWYKKKAQELFNKFIRLRDKDLPCISCGRHHQGQYHAGHYRTVGACPELRFDELNCHKQCSVCNNHLSANLLEYRINLIKKIGEDKVNWLEGYHEPKRYRKEDLVELIKTYKAKIKSLENP